MCSWCARRAPVQGGHPRRVPLRPPCAVSLRLSTHDTRPSRRSAAHKAPPARSVMLYRVLLYTERLRSCPVHESPLPPPRPRPPKAAIHMPGDELPACGLDAAACSARDCARSRPTLDDPDRPCALAIDSRRSSSARSTKAARCGPTAGGAGRAPDAGTACRAASGDGGGEAGCVDAVAAPAVGVDPGGRSPRASASAASPSQGAAR